MTGGSLPAHDLETDHGLCAPGHRDQSRWSASPGPTPPVPQVARSPAASGATGGAAADAADQARADVLVRIERMMDELRRARPLPTRQPRSQRRRSRSAATARRRRGGRQDAVVARQSDRRAGIRTVRLLIGSLFAFAVAAAVGLGTDLVRADARHRLRRVHHRRLDRLAEDRHDRHRSLCARDDRAQRRIADRRRRRRRLLRRRGRRGRALDGRCEVTCPGITPPARFWTLTLYDLEGRLVANALEPLRLHQPGNRAPAPTAASRSCSSPRARSGNWLPTGGVERYIWCCASTTRRSASRRAPAQKRRCRRSREGTAHDPLAALAVGGVLLGGIVHLATVLLLPRTATQDAYARLSRSAPVNSVVPLPAPTPDKAAAAVDGSGLRGRGLPLRSRAGPAEAARCRSARPIRRCPSIPARASPITRSTTAPPAGA